MRRDEHGQSLVETALLLPIVVILIVGLLDVSLAVWASNTLATAVREGTRYAIVHGADSTEPSGPGSTSRVEQHVRGHAIGQSNLSVTVTYPDGSNGRGKRVTVEATLPYKPVLSSAIVGNGLAVTLRSSSTLVIHR